MTKRQLSPLVLALAASALLHGLWLADIDWAWPLTTRASDDVLARNKAAPVKRVRLAATNTQATPSIPQVFFIAMPIGTVASSDSVQHAPAKNSAAESKAHKKNNTSAIAVTTSASDPNIATATTDSAAGTLSPNSVTTTPVTSPVPAANIEPSFPLNVLALQRAHYMGFSLDLRQQWFMEGDQYRINNDASKFGFKVTIVSEGHVSPDGLQPDHYRLSINNTLKNYADFDRTNNVLIHGKAGAAKTTALSLDFQDMASLPFQVAVSYEGEGEQRMQVTSGSSVYSIVLRVLAEETLRLPGGDIRTIHMEGSRDRADGLHQVGYDIWLAPAFRNFPVKFSGPDSKGNILEMSVQSLAFEGKTVFGKNVRSIPSANEPKVLPASLLQEHGLDTLQLGPPQAAESDPAQTP